MVAASASVSRCSLSQEKVNFTVLPSAQHLLGRSP
jgi:hypothetical protein